MTSDLISRFLRYVMIDSESKSEGNFIKEIRKELLSMGYAPDFYPETPGSDIGNIHLYVEVDSCREPVLLAAHTDTVSPGRDIHPFMEEDYIHTDRTTILGGDDKAGVAILMELLSCLKRDNPVHRPIEILFTYGEETGFRGSRAAIEGGYLISGQALVLDSMGPAGKIVRASAGESRMTVTVHGKSAHAGNAISEGINAIQIAADIITRLPLMVIDDRTSANVDTISSAGDPGAVTAECSFAVDLRSGSPERMKKLKDQMKTIVSDTASLYGGKADVKWEDMYPSFELSAEEDLTAQVIGIYNELGIRPGLVYSGGASDANILNAGGVKALNLGNGTEKIHTVEERLHIESFNLLYKAICRFCC